MKPIFRFIPLIFVLLFLSFYQSRAVAIGKKKIVVFTVKDGLPRNLVTCFVQDKYGYGWAGTKNGIARFDGYSFVSYDALEGKYINSLLLDQKDNLWVCSNKGLFKYNRLKDSFSLIREGYFREISIFKDTLYFLLGKKLWKLNDGQPVSVNLGPVNSYLVTNDGIWYNSGRNGLRNTNKNLEFLKGKIVTQIKKIGDKIFVACNDGNLFVINDKNEISEIKLNNHHKILDIEEIDGRLWIATDGNGILVLDRSWNLEEHIFKKTGKESIIPSNSIYDIYVSDEKAIWLSSYGAGLICLLYENMPFVNLTPDQANKNSLVAKEGTAIFIDGDKFFLGTNYGLSVWNDIKFTFRNFGAEKFTSELKGTKISAITKDKSNNYWIGTYDGLLGKYTYTNGMKLRGAYSPCTGNKITMQKIMHLFNLDDNRFLIASLVRNNNLVLFNTETGKSETVSVTNKLQRNIYQAMSIRKNQSGQIVVLINRTGLFQYIAKENKIYILTPEINEILKGYVLNDFYQDKQGDYWLATSVHGLLKISPKGEILDHWDIHKGLPTNTILRLESPDNKQLWASTISGLCKIDMETGLAQLFNSRHGLLCDEFSQRTSLVTPDKKIIFGCSEGFVIVDPAKVVIDTSKTKVIISDILFQNISIKKLKDESYLKSPLEETRKIVLPFSRNSFTIKFFTKDNDLPKYNNYAYRLRGFEKEWIYLGETNHITYTNLSSGEYVFEVKSTNKSNVWNNNPTSLIIEILPPWYLTWWAFVLYAALFLTGVFLIFEYYKKRLHWKMELDMAKFKARQEHELTEKKLTFFTNISHDLKTAATLISAPVNDLLDAGGLKDEQVKKLKVVKRNAERLYKLNADLLEFRKITKNQLPLKVREVDLKPVVYNIFEAFNEQCEKKEIEYAISYDVQGKVFVDPKKIEKILWNLLSNAVKYTGNEGKISLKVSSLFKDDGAYIKMEVKDNGKGMSKEYLTRIFDRFYQVGKSETSLFGGVGIGLFIVKELVALHHGDIIVQSEPGKGSTFTVTLPVGKEFFKEEEISSDEVLELTDATEMSTFISEPYHEEELKNTNIKYNRQKIVIVEDNPEMQQYLYDHFSKDNNVFVADNGVKGLELTREKEPDIVISDVKMPEMTGYELCDKIKNDFNTSHIPVILLTANTSLDDKLKGMYAGADSYITKPFEVKYLDAVVGSLLVNRQKLREKFLGLEPLNENTEKLSKHDIEFINELKEFILTHISEQDLNIELLVKRFAISRSQLNRKIKSLTGLTPNNYLKTIRLKKAYELLKEKDSRVSEVAYRTGFSDPNYFTICFKKEFGENPSRI